MSDVAPLSTVQQEYLAFLAAAASDLRARLAAVSSEASALLEGDLSADADALPDVSRLLSETAHVRVAHDRLQTLLDIVPVTGVGVRPDGRALLTSALCDEMDTSTVAC